MNKETKEAWVLGGQTINAVYEVAEDKRVNLDDLGRILPVILGASKGVEGFSEIGPEQATIGPEEKADIRRGVVAAMPGVPEDQADDWADVLMGGLSVYRLGHRAGKKEAAQAIFAQLEADGLIVSEELKAAFAA